ncbi:peroxiredoxin [Pigmentiphaga sp.]|uniref:peroxiredoxin n=1 Tax=Pigmentiphaga sp. TaxID=1977564 RepID=UPI00128CB988|nr:peroxiredoxin [Pigmentiphaga sp.]MPS30592.1 peroxiredoxin [Alcaligenaceae bacterium SAGV5]MPS52728.1 peroxiredoxin [Alcaligenaceae bacterium SAGV3]MPT57970.1 peroxiredoxin [Alcaligenaceae bacterium]
MSTAIGRAAPAFTAPSTDGDLSLKDLKGRIVVMYFYPRDNTPGCTTEGQNFRDRYADFQAAGAEILGVSRDTLASHQKFKEKQGFPFPLVADPDETLCELYGVMKMKNMYGKQVRGIERSTFLIDAQGKLRQEWRGVKVPGHVDAVLEAVRGLA